MCVWGGAEPALKLALGGLTCIWSQHAFHVHADAKPHRPCKPQSPVWVQACLPSRSLGLSQALSESDQVNDFP